MGKTTTNYSFKKNALGHPVRDTFTAANLDLIDAAINSLRTGIHSFHMRFQEDRLTATKIYFPFAVTIDKIRTTVMAQLAATDVGTITGANSVGNSDDGVVTIAESAALNEEDSTEPSSNNEVAANSYYKLTSAKTTPGGMVLVTLEYTRTI